MANNEKATIREVRDLIDDLNDNKITPMLKDIVIIKQQIENLCKNLGDKDDYYLKEFDKNEKEHKEFRNLLGNIKIKVWGLAGLIGAIMGFVGVIIGKFIGG